MRPASHVIQLTGARTGGTMSLCKYLYRRIERLLRQFYERGCKMYRNFLPSNVIIRNSNTSAWQPRAVANSYLGAEEPSSQPPCRFHNACAAALNPPANHTSFYHKMNKEKRREDGAKYVASNNIKSREEVSSSQPPCRFHYT